MFTWSHDLHYGNDHSVMLSGCYQTLQNQNFEVFKHVRIFSAHNFDEFWGQFEGWLFETQIFWRSRQNKAEIDVNEMTVTFQQNVSVVPEITEFCKIYLKSRLVLRTFKLLNQ